MNPFFIPQFFDLYFIEDWLDLLIEYIEIYVSKEFNCTLIHHIYRFILLIFHFLIFRFFIVLEYLFFVIKFLLVIFVFFILLNLFCFFFFRSEVNLSFFKSNNLKTIFFSCPYHCTSVLWQTLNFRFHFFLSLEKPWRCPSHHGGFSSESG